MTQRATDTGKRNTTSTHVVLLVQGLQFPRQALLAGGGPLLVRSVLLGQPLQLLRPQTVRFLLGFALRLFARQALLFQALRFSWGLCGRACSELTADS